MGRAVEAQAKLAPEVADDVVFVGLSVETGLPPEELRAYAEREGFPFVFAVMSAEFQRAFVDQVGREAVVPPLMPHLVIGPDGEPRPLSLGEKSADELAAELTAIQTGGDG